LLAKAVARYPGGVTDRWDKISLMVRRTVKEVSNSSSTVVVVVVVAVAVVVQGWGT